jgi:hypothetical protein
VKCVKYGVTLEIEEKIVEELKDVVLSAECTAPRPSDLTLPLDDFVRLGEASER